MKKTILIFACILCTFTLSAQLTIEECQQKARVNFPLIKQQDLIAQTEKYNLSNAARGYLPQVSLAGKATWQSDVTKLDVPAPYNQILNVEPMSKDQYQAALEVNQLVYDGGIIRSQRKTAKAAAEMQRQKNEVDLYAVQERVTQVFFGILLIDEQWKQNDLLREELQTNYDKVSAYIKNGVANQADLDAVRVEQLRCRQRETELNALRKSYAAILLTLMGERPDENISLVKPDYQKEVITTENNRPELKFFEAQQLLYDTQMRNIKSANLPIVSLFAQGGYGKPALNMLENKFSPFFIGGVRLMWNLSGFYTQKNNLQLLETEKQSVSVQRETFLFNSNLKNIEQQNLIDKFEVQLADDDEIIALRQNVKKATEAKVANGTLTVSDLIHEINAENLSRQDKVLHEIQLLIAIYQLKLINNE
ncbi:MAG: TolC family protein [Prevotellaceae bacterium]|jgi:outer membrane protein TolC|nr:TolC family protein [Prevotellaceae bacterium]